MLFIVVLVIVVYIIWSKERNQASRGAWTPPQRSDFHTDGTDTDRTCSDSWNKRWVELSRELSEVEKKYIETNDPRYKRELDILVQQLAAVSRKIHEDD